MLVSPMAWRGVKSVLADGVYSVEVKCRRVLRRGAFDWRGVLTAEAAALHHAAGEAEQVSDVYQGRILVFVEIQGACPQGEHVLHGSILRRSAGGGLMRAEWKDLWGWEGFLKPTAPPARPAAPGVTGRPPAPSPGNSLYRKIF